MKFRRIWTLWGPNIWGRFPVAEAWLDLDEYRGRRTDALPGFADRLLAALPSLANHPGPGGTAGGFAAALRAGVGLGFVLERVALEWQALGGQPQGFGATIEDSPEPGLCKVAVQYQHRDIAVKGALESGLELIEALARGDDFDLAPHHKKLADLVYDNTTGRTTGAIVAAIRRRGLPYEHISPAESRFVQVGWGVKGRRFMASETDRTGAIAEHLSTDKDLTKKILGRLGVPVPEGRIVTDADDAWAAAEELGVPVVIKPLDRDLAIGVELNLVTREQVVAAYHSAREKSRRVIVEKFAPGTEHRLLVVGDKLVAAANIRPPRVTGDGRSTILALIEATNADPCRDDAYKTPKAKIPIDAKTEEGLARQGLTLESVLAEGQSVVVRHAPPIIEGGGDLIDVTDRVHAEVAARAVEALKILHLDVAGLDLVVEDIGRPLEEQGGVIVEVNAGPGLWLHLEPYSDKTRDVGGAILASIVPPDEDGRIPVAAVTGVNGKTTTSRLIAHIAREQGYKVGLACTDGTFIDDRRISGHDCSGPQSARSVLLNPYVELAVLETARGGILREGLGYDLCDVAVVTNIAAGDHLGHKGIDTVEALADVKATVVRAVHPDRGTAVLNADDSLTAGMASVCPGRVAYFAREAANPLVARTLAQGGRAAFVRDGQVVLAKGQDSEILLGLDAVPMTHGGVVRFQVENVLAAALAAAELGLPVDVIRRGLRTFDGGIAQAPGRFNVLEVDGATIIVDFGHNATAIRAVAEAVGDLPPHDRRLAVYCGCNRRDDDVIGQGEALGSVFDRILLYADRDNTDREDGELNQLVRQGIARAARAPEVDEFAEEFDAVEAALADLRRGDLLLLSVSSIERCLELIRGRYPDASPR